MVFNVRLSAIAAATLDRVTSLKEKEEEDQVEEFRTFFVFIKECVQWIRSLLVPVYSNGYSGLTIGSSIALIYQEGGI